MKNSILLTLFLSLLIIQSCEKKEEKYERLIIGQWTTYSDFASSIFTGGGNGKRTIYTFTEDTYTVYDESEDCSLGKLIRGPYEYSIKGDSIYLNTVPRKIVGLNRQYVNIGGNKLSRCK
jgi:hypothetical protein